jgi:membrane associated rhomboid family serine protease
VVLIAADIVGVRRARFGIDGWMKIDHAGHLGGYATGILAALAIKHRARQRKEATEVEEKGMDFNDSHGNGQM